MWQASDCSLALPPGDDIIDGEWLVATFEVRGSWTAAAAHVAVGDRGPSLRFERRDWQRIEAFSRVGVGAAPVPETTTPTVWVVDDDEEVRQLVVAVLETVGLVVEGLGSAEECLARMHRELPDLLVVDWLLPAMSGLDLCAQIRREDRWARLPVIFLTARASSADMVEAFAGGADDFVAKPFRVPELAARVLGLLRRTSRDGEL
jgi:two-component system, OmpR family, phosphate regulon response regulator PhoB